METVEVELMVVGGALDGTVYRAVLEKPLPEKIMASEIHPYTGGVFLLMMTGALSPSGVMLATYVLREDDQHEDLIVNMQSHLRCRQENLARKSRKRDRPQLD